MNAQGLVRKRGGRSNSWHPNLAAVAVTCLTFGVTHPAIANDTSGLLDSRTTLEAIKKNEPTGTPKTSDAGELTGQMTERHELPYPALVIGKHPLLVGIARLFGAEGLFPE